MRTSQVKVLLIGRSEGTSKLLLDTIAKLAFKCTFVTKVEEAIQKSIKDQPDLIICMYDLNELNGFQLFNILDNEILKNEIPFVMVFNQFRKNDILVGVELGIDSFIFPPFDAERIQNILLKQLEKNAERKSAELIKFDSVCKVIPYGIFVSNDRQVVETNETFDELVKNTPRLNGKHTLREIFQFKSYNEDELKLSRFMNGLTRDCCFNDIQIQGKPNDRFNLYCTLVKKRGSSARVVGIVIPVKDEKNIPDPLDLIRKDLDKNEFLDPSLITTRERQVLQLSSQGLPIKQIAERLSISERTVEKHRSNIIQKTKTENIMEAVFKYGRNFVLNT